MNFYAFTSKGGLKTLSIGIAAALFFSIAFGLTYRWNPAPATTRPDSELAGLDARALMAKFSIQPLGQTPVPDFQLKNLDEGLVSMASFRGKVVLLNFWATW